MAKDKNYTAFRRELARDYSMLIHSLDKAFKPDSHEKPTVYNDYPLRNVIKDIEAVEDPICAYKVDNLKIPVDKQKHISPSGINVPYVRLSISSSMRLACMGQEMEDPFTDLCIKVDIMTDSHLKDCELTCGYHIDRWSEGDRKEQNEIHPVYHIHYTNSSWYGARDNKSEALTLDTPRLIHHPMELFLTIAEVVGTFNKPVYEKLMDDPYFAKCCHKYAGIIVLPYFESLCNTIKDNKGIPNPLIPYLI